MAVPATDRERVCLAESLIGRHGTHEQIAEISGVTLERVLEILAPKEAQKKVEMTAEDLTYLRAHSDFGSTYEPDQIDRIFTLEEVMGFDSFKIAIMPDSLYAVYRVWAEAMYTKTFGTERTPEPEEVMARKMAETSAVIADQFSSVIYPPTGDRVVVYVGDEQLPHGRFIGEYCGRYRVVEHDDVEDNRRQWDLHAFRKRKKIFVTKLSAEDCSDCCFGNYLRDVRHSDRPNLYGVVYRHPITKFPMVSMITKKPLANGDILTTDFGAAKKLEKHTY